MEELIAALQENTNKLSEISFKLDNINGIYGLDDLVAKLDEISNEIRGESGYNLTDIYDEISAIKSDTLMIEGNTGAIASNTL